MKDTKQDNNQLILPVLEDNDFFNVKFVTEISLAA